jgi:hypothetical protein
VFAATDLGGSVVVAGTTLSPGGPAVTISGTVISDARTGLVVGTATVPLSPFVPGASGSTTGGDPAQYTGGGRRNSLGWVLVRFVGVMGVMV